MTRKDYELIAAALASALRDFSTGDDTRDNAYNTGVRVAAGKVAIALERTNPRFDYARFKQACGLEA